MTSVVRQRSDTQAEKKSLKKKASVEEVVKTVQKNKKNINEPVKKNTEDKVDKPKKKSVSEKAAPKKEKEVVVKKEKKEKIPKKVNVKPTIASAQGLNLSVAKVKNIISNLCINKEIIDAATDIKSSVLDEETSKPNKANFTLDNLSPVTLEYLEFCQISNLESCKFIEYMIFLLLIFLKCHLQSQIVSSVKI